MKMSREQLQANYEASTRENSLLRFAMMDMVNDSITWRAWAPMGDGTQYRYGWARLDSASGGYLVWIFRAPGQSDFVRVDYLDAMHEHRPSYGRPEDNALIDAIDAARYARTKMVDEGHAREANKSYQKPATSILDQTEHAAVFTPETIKQLTAEAKDHYEWGGQTPHCLNCDKPATDFCRDNHDLGEY